jgi:prefoldin subunit 1
MQVNKIETTKKIRMLDLQIETLKQQKRRHELTQKEVESLTENAKVYAAVGRMFVLSTVPDIKKELVTKQDKVEKVVDMTSKSKNILLNNLAEQEQGLRDLVEAKKNESK